MTLQLDELQPQPWMRLGACTNNPDPDMWFAKPNTARASEAKRICKGCPVRDDCLTYSSLPGAFNEYGIFGAQGPLQRGRDQYRAANGHALTQGA